ncbi:hypothetical protein Poli38472_000061 [Pythium oligandrum]|uniref:Uncharacterized protein n=1 Tax=Pythium oligandrum TaxID=41045 RepID=A0A8K1CBJ5_PYTOL|nr:hypothetical protein Poli38472_000061 [Pythium oligandrum]|eukprot:TMW60019.1 hypothetical protein Poli38472_000061 [Pythium oligandrum]
MYADVDPAATGGRAFRQARPLSEQVVEGLKFLRRIEHIVIADVTKGDYVISVYFKGARAPSCSTKQSFSKFRNLHKACVGWSSCHVELSPEYGVAPCLYCRAFNDAYEIDQWPGSSDRLFGSKTKLMRVLEARLNEYVQRARGEAQGPYLCEGIENIPLLVAAFLLKGVEMATLRTME